MARFITRNCIFNFSYSCHSADIQKLLHKSAFTVLYASSQFYGEKKQSSLRFLSINPPTNRNATFACPFACGRRAPTRSLHSVRIELSTLSSSSRFSFSCDSGRLFACLAAQRSVRASSRVPQVAGETRQLHGSRLLSVRAERTLPLSPTG